MENLFTGTEWEAYLQPQSTRILLLPKSVDHMNLDQMLDIWVESVHEKVNVMDVVELPAFGNERVAQDVLESDCIPVHLWWQVPDTGQLEGGFEHPRWC